MTKTVWDMTTSELDWILLTERTRNDMGKHHQPHPASDPAPSTKLERDLQLSLYRDGFLYGLHEAMGAGYKGPTLHNDADWACGYSHGSSVGLQALSGYRDFLDGK